MMDKLQKQKKTPKQIIETIEKGRKKKKAGVARAPPGANAVYRYLRGETHVTTSKETRGAKPVLGKGAMKVYNEVRKDLQKTANNEYVVTWASIAEAGQRALRRRGMLKRTEEGWCEDYLRKKMRDVLGVGKRPAPQRIGRDPADERRRLSKAAKWEDEPASFWTDDVAYLDNKSFVEALTPTQRTRMLQVRTGHHLRTAAECKNTTYVVPKGGRMLPGIPSVEISAVVHRDRIVMWRVTKQKWCGAEAANMYADLGKVLKRVFGHNRRKFRLVEDGDPKGYQSKKGKDAKDTARIESWQLPPRSPDLMPLDYSLWARIESRMFATAPSGRETHEAFLSRLRATAFGLSRAEVAGAVRQMKGRISAVVKSKGKYILEFD